MALSDELTSAIEEAIDDAGESVVIHDVDGNVTKTVDALVTGGAGGFDDVAGGYFTPVDYTISVIKTDLDPLIPTPGMIVEARSRDLRIAENGVDTLRVHYRLRCIDRDQ
jgi:hypothetical protein